jgi:SAM-dependent MidA family methyltransferase
LPAELRQLAHWSSPEDLAASAGDGLVLSNEFYDALPVHRVRMSAHGLEEIRVGWKEAVGFVPVAVTPENRHLAQYFRDYGVPLAEGQEAEACLEALQWADRAARILRRGYWVTIDYGDTAERLYGPARRRGTLLGYRGHQVVDDPLRAVGFQDLTAHVNFTALIRRGQRHQIDAAPLRSQTEVLLGLGILERMEERDREEPGKVARLRGRLAAKELFAPGGMGETFRVLIQAREAPLEGLRGLSSPWRRPDGTSR